MRILQLSFPLNVLFGRDVGGDPAAASCVELLREMGY